MAYNKPCKYNVDILNLNIISNNTCYMFSLSPV